MNTDTQPLLADADRDLGHRHPTYAAVDQSTSVSSLLGTNAFRSGVAPFEVHNVCGRTARRRKYLICGAIGTCIMVLILDVCMMWWWVDGILVSLAIRSGFTVTVLVFLLIAERHRGPRWRLLGRTTTQIYILCGTAFSWMLLEPAMKKENALVCWHRLFCQLFTIVYDLYCIVIFFLFFVAYMTHRRAVEIQEVALIPVSGADGANRRAS